MARADFAGTVSDYVASTYRFGNSDLLALAGGVTLTFWDAETGGTQHTDLLLDGAATSTITSGSDGSVPVFSGPDGVTVMWADAGGGDRVRMVTTDGAAIQAAKTAAEAAADRAEAVGDTNDTIVKGLLDDPASATATALSATIAAGGSSNDRLNNVLPPAMTAWTRVATILTNDAAWKEKHCGIGMSVVWDDASGQYAMIYGGTSAADVSSFGIAYSPDGETWTDYGSNPILFGSGVSGDPDQGSITFPQVMRHGGQYLMYYIGFDLPGYEQGDPSICYATADALLGPWTRHGAVATPADFGFTNDGAEIYRPTVVRWGDLWVLFTNTGPAPGSEEIYYATAPSPEGPFTYGGHVMDAPSLTGDPTETLISDPEVVRWGDQWFLFCWSRGAKIYVAHCDHDQFPAGPWTALGGEPIFTNDVRPVFFQTPNGPRLLTHAGSFTSIRLNVPSAHKTLPQIQTLRGGGQSRMDELVRGLGEMGFDAAAPAAVADSFNRPDGAMGYTDTGGLPWQEGGGTGWAIAGGKAVWTGGATSGRIVVDSGLSDNYEVAVRMDDENGQYPVTIVGKGTSPTAFTQVYRNGSAWVMSPAGANPNVVDLEPLEPGDTVRLRIEGTSWTLYVNDSLRATFYSEATGTYQGIGGASNLTHTVDNFSITDLSGSQAGGIGAGAVTFRPSGSLVSTNVQEAVEEVLAAAGVSTILYKSADTVRNNTNTRTDDPHLTTTVEAGTYLVEGFLHYNATTTADLGIQFTVPGSSTWYWSPFGPPNNASGNTAISIGRFASQSFQLGGIGANVAAAPKGYLVVPASGTFALSWAQWVAEVSDATLYAGSWLRLTKIA